MKKTSEIYKVNENIRGRAAAGCVRPTTKEIYKGGFGFNCSQKFPQQTPAINVKTVIFDFESNWGASDHIAVSDIAFYYEGSKLTITGYVASATSTYSGGGTYSENKAFDSDIATHWLSDYISVHGTSQRLICVLAAPIDFDKIVVTNYGPSTVPSIINRDIKDTKIYVCSEVYDDVVYGNVVPNSLKVFDGVVSKRTDIEPEFDIITVV